MLTQTAARDFERHGIRAPHRDFQESSAARQIRYN
jgi:hypothetical protein